MFLKYEDTNISEDDQKFLAYCETHSESQRALFSKEEVNRLYELAGAKPLTNICDFVSIDRYNMREMINYIKVRQSKELWLFPEDTILQLERQARQINE